MPQPVGNATLLPYKNKKFMTYLNYIYKGLKTKKGGIYSEVEKHR